MLGVLRGGLGNQLFQVTAYLTLARQANKKLIIDTNHFLHKSQRNLGRKIEVSEFLATKQITYRQFKNPKMARAFCAWALLIRILFDLLKIDSPLMGVWASDSTESPWTKSIQKKNYRYLDSYFAHFGETKEEGRMLSPDYDEILNWLSAKLESRRLETNRVGASSIALHLRLTDLDPKLQSLVSVDKIRAIIGQAITADRDVILYSDDNYVALKNLESLEVPIRLAHNFEHPIETLLDMASNNLLIASYSTFSWWAGALISKRGGTVFFPKLKDEATDQMFIPETWVRF
jgi:hypothetical protein